MSPEHLLSRLILLVSLLLCAATGARAQSASPGGGLLPVTQAFALKVNAAQPGKVALHWDIAPHYYLYRGRIHAEILTPGVKAGQLDLPPGTPEHDPYLGDVTIYHGSVDGSLAYSTVGAAPAALKVAVTYQGCHEVDPKICYPPNTQTFELPVNHAVAAAASQPAVVTAAPTAAQAPSSGPGTIRWIPESGTQRSRATPGQLMIVPDARQAGKPLPPDQAFVVDAIARSPTELLLRWTMPHGYYIYRQHTSISLQDAGGATLGEPRWPAGVLHTDPYFGEQMVYFDEVDLPVPLLRNTAGNAHSVTLRVTFQGCQNGGICYPPLVRNIKVDVPAASSAQLTALAQAAASASSVIAPPSASSSGVAAVTPAAAPPPPPANDGGSAVDKLAASLAGKGRWLALLGFFGAGLLLAFTPCVLPMIPILTGLIAGSGRRLSTRHAFSLSLVYVLATCLVFTLAGVAAGLIGANIAAAMQKPWILIAFALLFVLLALSMFGLYDLQLPASWQARLAGASNRQRGGSYAGVAVMGVLSALIVGPCVAPPLAAAVLFIGQTRDPAFGGAALFLLSLGMSIPLLVFGTAVGRWLPRTGAWMTAVKGVFGFVFLALAVWMWSRILPTPWILALSGALLIGLAAWLLASLRHGFSGWRIAIAALGAITFIVGATELVGSAAGSQDLLRPLAGVTGNAAVQPMSLPFQRVASVADVQRAVASASTVGKPVMLDFYADWCVSCKEMEHLTFTKPAVRQALANFVLLQADVTANNADDQALLKQYGLFGPPATLFFNAAGQEQRALRLVGFEDATKFVARLDAVRQ